MAKGASKARESRVNIVISDRLKGGAEPELPFRILVMGDYTMKTDKRAIDQREPLDINKSNFNAVMQKFNLSLDISVPDRIAGQGEMAAQLRFNTPDDFRPEAIARQVPQLRKLLEIREAMKALRQGLNNKENVVGLREAFKDPAMVEKVLKMIQSPSTPQGEANPAEAPADTTPPGAPSK
jgi:type VI secretion system protein ImpB